ncbi:hypothetical protein ACIA8R_46165 [Nonomuraea sp. NPDC051191]|uniref:hypothetical protein n=1 Tax=Nonomuraea sp. NPDC051191 TaxID=3364372 RepID=UPI0037B57F9A
MNTRSSAVTMTTAIAGAVLFLLGTILHPARDGHGMAVVVDRYGITHAIQAIGLALQAVALARLTPARRLSAHHAALAGVLAWLALIVYDGSHNPVTARFAPELVHTSADLSPGGALFVLPGLLLFPAGYAILATSLARGGARWCALLLGIGALTYWLGGLLIFAAGPRSPFVQILEVIGAGLYALGFALLARTRLTAPASGRAS